MSKTRRGLSFLLCLMMVFSLFAGMPIIPNADLGTEAEAASSNTNPNGKSEWVTAWHTSMVYLDSESDSSSAVNVVAGMNERTLRTLIPMTMGGKEVRITYSNEYAPNNEHLKIGEITLAKGQAGNVNEWANDACVKIKEGGLRTYFASAIASGKAYIDESYYDREVLVVNPGEIVTSDPINISDLGINALDFMSVSTWVCDMNSNITGFKKGFTGGLIGGETKYLGIALNGTWNHTEEKKLGEGGIVPPVALSKSNDTGDYNVIPFLNTVEVKRTNSNQYTTVIMGDSTLANDIPVKLAEKMKANKVDDVAFVWAAVKGNELLLNGQDGSADHNGNAMDEAAIQVIDEVLALNGVKKVIVKVGINDILHPECSDMRTNFSSRTPAQITEQIIAGYKYLVDKCHNHKDAAGNPDPVEIYFYELTPWRDDNGKYYSRAVGDAGNTLFYSDTIDQIRRNVNAWLKTYGDNYDNMTPDQDDSYSGTITLGNQYGSKGYTKAYDQKVVNVNHDNFDRFGYIGLEGLCAVDTTYTKGSASCGEKNYDFATALARAYTTDGIHYTKAGQARVANLTPLSIFWKTPDNTGNAGEEVNIMGIYFATQTMNKDHQYFICNTNAGSTVGKAVDAYNEDNETQTNQSEKGWIAGNPGVESSINGWTETKEQKTFWNPNPDGEYLRNGGARSDVTETEVMVQRGTSGAPYIVDTNSLDASRWKLTDATGKGNYFWMNGNFYLSWYFPENMNKDVIYTTGVRAAKPDEVSGIWKTISGKNKDVWYTHTAVKAKSDMQVELYYDALATNKPLVFHDGQFWTIQNDPQERNYFLNDWNTLVTLYDNTSAGVHVTLDILQNNGDTVKLMGADGKNGDNNTIYNANPTKDYANLQFKLSTQRLNNLGQLETSAGVQNFSDQKNDARGPFPNYTFGDNQRIYWNSDNLDVATVKQSSGTGNHNEYAVGGGKVEFTGNPGTATITANYFWKEYDGIDYIWEEGYSAAQKDAAIANGSKIPSTNETGFHWVKIGTSAGGENWAWTNYHWLTSDTTITNITDVKADISVDGEFEDVVTIDNVVNGTSSLLEAVGISSPANVDMLPTDGKWEWNIPENNIIASNSVSTDVKKNDMNSVVWNGNEGEITATATYVDSSGRTYYYNDRTGVLSTTTSGRALTSSVTITVKAKQPAIDIFYSDGKAAYPDMSELNGAAIGDTVELLAKNTATEATCNNPSWSWELVDVDATEETESIKSTDVVTLAPNDDKSTTLTVKGEGLAIIKATLTYNQGGADKTVDSYIFINVNYGTTTSNTVIDFGLPVDIDLGKLTTAETVDGISASLDSKVTEKTTKYENAYFKDCYEIEGTGYTAKLGIISIEGKVYSTGVMTYTPNAISDGSKNTIYYQANFGSFCKYDHVDIIPATSIYYEDTVGVEFIHGQVNGANAAEGSHGYWSSVVEEEPNTSTLANDIYGYDEAYNVSNKYSNGSAKIVTVGADNNPKNGGNWPEAKFTFTGTGFDIISLTDCNSGIITVNVKGTGSVASVNKNWIVNNYYAASYEQTGYKVITWTYQGEGWGWRVTGENAIQDVATVGDVSAIIGADYDPSTYKFTLPSDNSKPAYEVIKNYKWENNPDGAIYQVPVIKNNELPYGTYEVTIKVQYSSGFDKTGNNAYNFTLDAIRIYNPMGNNSDAQNIYVSDGEGYPEFETIRNILVDADSSATVSGCVFINGLTMDSVTDMSTYSKEGPNNEVYLSENHAVAFNLNTRDGLDKVMLGLKSISGEPVTVMVNGKLKIETSSTTDMYYDITGAYEPGKVLTIMNSGENVVSLTTIKTTYDSPETEADGNNTRSMTFSVSPEDMISAKAMIRSMMLLDVPTEDSSDTSNVFAPSVNVTTSSDKVKVGDNITITVKTSNDVAYITVNGEKVTSHDDDYVWTFTVRAENEGEVSFEVIAYNAEGVAADCTSIATVEVEANATVDNSNTIKVAVEKAVAKIKNILNKFFGGIFNH